MVDMKVLKMKLAAAEREIELQRVKLGALEDVAVERGRQLRRTLLALANDHDSMTCHRLLEEIDPRGLIREGKHA